MRKRKAINTETQSAFIAKQIEEAEWQANIEFRVQRERKRSSNEDLSEDSLPFNCVHELGTEFAVKDIVEETTKEMAFVLEGLERDLLRNVIRGVRHCSLLLLLLLEQSKP